MALITGMTTSRKFRAAARPFGAHAALLGRPEQANRAPRSRRGSIGPATFAGWGIAGTGVVFFLKDPSHAGLKGDALVGALQPLSWDPSVKALIAFPQIIAMMSDHIEWTEAVGVAFTTQQAEVMARVQALRRLALKSGRLNKLRH